MPIATLHIVRNYVIQNNNNMRSGKIYNLRFSKSNNKGITIISHIEHYNKHL